MTDPSPSRPSTPSPTASGRRSSSSTRRRPRFYGDERYADRLEDPGPPAGREAAPLMEETKAEAPAIPDDGLPTEERITRDMLIVVAELNIEEDDQRSTGSASSTR